MHAEFAETFAAYTRQYTAGRHFSMFLKIVILLPISHYETIFSIIIYESCIYEIVFFFTAIKVTSGDFLKEKTPSPESNSHIQKAWGSGSPTSILEAWGSRNLKSIFDRKPEILEAWGFRSHTSIFDGEPKFQKPEVSEATRQSSIENLRFYKSEVPEATSLSHIESWGSWSQVSVASRKPRFLEWNGGLTQRPWLIDSHSKVSGSNKHKIPGPTLQLF